MDELDRVLDETRAPISAGILRFDAGSIRWLREYVELEGVPSAYKCIVASSYRANDWHEGLQATPGGLADHFLLRTSGDLGYVSALGR